jgi:hypothetical protein
MLFGTSPQQQPYLGYPQGATIQQPIGQQIPPLLQQLMANPAFMARLQMLQGTGLGGIPIQQSPYGLGRIGTQPVATGAYSLR